MGTARVYLQPMEMVYNAIFDLIELQKGTEILNDPASGKLNYRISMYGFMWEYCFIAQSIDNNRCVVELKIEEAENARDNEHRYLENLILREYALLDKMLLLGTPS